jgi:hypothetical protein
MSFTSEPLKNWDIALLQHCHQGQAVDNWDIVVTTCHKFNNRDITRLFYQRQAYNNWH